LPIGFGNPRADSNRKSPEEEEEWYQPWSADKFIWKSCSAWPGRV